MSTWHCPRCGFAIRLDFVPLLRSICCGEIYRKSIQVSRTPGE